MYLKNNARSFSSRREGCFQKDVEVRSGRYRPWSVFSQNARPSVERHQSKSGQQRGHITSTLSALSNATGVTSLRGSSSSATSTSTAREPSVRGQPPSRCQHCKKQDLDVRSCIHEIHTLASPADAVGSGLTYAEQLPRIHLCKRRVGPRRARRARGASPRRRGAPSGGRGCPFRTAAPPWRPTRGCR
jgi:hypothetical protein